MYLEKIIIFAARLIIHLKNNTPMKKTILIIVLCGISILIHAQTWVNLGDSIGQRTLPTCFEGHGGLIPETFIDHEKNSKRLLSTLPNDDNTNTQRTSNGEFYSYTGWFVGSDVSCRSLTHYTDHGKKVELPYSYNTNTPGVMSIGDIYTDATPGVIYNRELGQGTPRKLFRSTDYGFTWELIDEETGASDNYWTFKGVPGVLLKRNTNPAKLRISYDYGSSFETLDIPPFYLYSVAGWNAGEFIAQNHSGNLPYYLTHSMDFNQTSDTVFFSDLGYFNMAAGASEGELYTYYKSYDTVNYYTMSYALYFSPDYGRNNRMVMKIDSLIVGDACVFDYWEFVADNEPGVFYSIKKVYNQCDINNSGKYWINYYRDYGETLVTTYFHHFRPDWYSQHTPVMDCEVASFDENRVTLRWTEPELRPEEDLVGYQVYRGESLVGEELITETEYTDNYSGGGRLNYHVLAVYSDGTTSKSYNIVYCDKTESVPEEGSVDAITLSPNPTSGIVRIEGATVAEVKVYNALGQLVKTTRNSNEINLKGLPQGIYTLHITNEVDNHVIRKVIRV